MEYRLGVDVGGTFTDAVALDVSNMELAGIVKVPTTHHHPNGVSEGIRIALRKLMEQCQIRPEEVAFIAHGTTQATNALLEGDVDPVAVLSAGSGLGAGRVKGETSFERLELSAGKGIRVRSRFIKGPVEEAAPAVLDEFAAEGFRTMVAATAYSVDDPAAELQIAHMAAKRGLSCTATHEMSSLYGLRTRTKTAILNASILPKMVETTGFMQSSVQAAGIGKPLMIMRSDGGVMSAAEIKRRPIQTILSGPAAGVAGALLYGKVSEGVFLEVGGTSTDLSVIHNGQVMVKWAQIGPHKTYVNSLDIHTVAIAGGSMLRLEGGQVVCGPRSAHIAGLGYCCFAGDLTPGALSIETYRVAGDEADYFVLCDAAAGKRCAITLTCLANLAGAVPRDDFAAGSQENARMAVECLSAYLKKPLETILEEVFSSYCAVLAKAVEEFMETYQLERKELSLVGGGGGCAAVAPILAARMGLPYVRCPNAQAISPIGVAMAMVREICERTMANPSQEDLLRLREEAVAGAIRAGAVRDRIEVAIETEPQKNLVRAIATGVADGKLQPRASQKIGRDALLGLLRDRDGITQRELCQEAENGFFHIFQFREKPGSWWRALLRKKESPLYLMAPDGTARLHKLRGALRISCVERLADDLDALLDEYSEFGDMGEKLPEIFIVVGDRVLDYSMIRERGQILRLSQFETEGRGGQELVFLVCGY